jgi:CheY-like chemotaxis protein
MAHEHSMSIPNHAVAVMIVDDEEDIRFSFVDRFEERFRVHTAANGAEALEILCREPDIAVVVTDVRMPVMTGLELIRQTRAFNPDLGFIVVSGQAEAQDVIEALRAGARNFLKKPYALEELEQSLLVEVRHFQAFRENRIQREREKALEDFIVSVDRIAYRIPNELSWVNPLAFRLVGLMNVIPICGEESRLNVALGLIEMITNAIEHGNLGITGDEKQALKAQGEKAYAAEIRRRARSETYRSRRVRVIFTLDPERATFRIEDQGEGFDTTGLPDPTDPSRLFAPSGRGILLTRAFLDEVNYDEKGNAVTLVKYRDRNKGL